MADIGDVLNAISAIVASTLYPNGTGQPSLITAPVKVMQGWPAPKQLQSDLAAGIVSISVFAGMVEKNTTRYNPNQARQLSINPATLVLTISGRTITVSGTVTTPQTVGVLVNKQPYVYSVQANDTLTSVATGLALAIAAGVAGTTSAAGVITLPTTAYIAAARVAMTGVSYYETKRQQRDFSVTFWCQTPTLRNTSGPPVELALSQIEFLTAADQSAMRIIYARTDYIDELEKVQCFRRTIHYTVEYPTILFETDTQIMNVAETVTGGYLESAPTVTVNL